MDTLQLFKGRLTLVLGVVEDGSRLEETWRIEYRAVPDLR